MHRLHGAMSSMLCCFGFQHDDEPNRPRMLRNLPVNPSSISMNMPTISTPDAISTSEELRRIFASDHIPTRYATPPKDTSKRLVPQGSLDLSFQFGENASRKQPSSRVDQVTNHIKQKLSRSAFSRSESRDGDNLPQIDRLRVPDQSTVNEHTELLGVSQRSTGLTDLLASRTGCEGGYDSDAKSILTPTALIKTGTAKISPAFVKRSLKTIESEGGEQPICITQTATGWSDSVEARRTDCKSSPFPLTPTKLSFTTAMEIGPDESPSDVLRRLSVSIANGTVKPPQTPELRAMRMPSVSHVEKEWRLSISAPERTSSIPKLPPNLHVTMRRLSDKFENAKRDSVGSSAASNQRDSLISQLDPALINFIERFTRENGSNDRIESNVPMSNSKGVGTRNRLDDGATEESCVIIQSNKGSSKEISSTTTSTSQSLHLFDMRISQRLASDSRVAMQSSNQASSHSLVSSPESGTACQGRTVSMGRFPTFINTEHVRKPSDPRTKQIFESSKPDTSIVTKLKSPLLRDSLAQSHAQPKRIQDDASSYYGSESGGQSSTSIPATRRDSIKNPNSIGVGGRSFSQGYSAGNYGSQVNTSTDKIGHRQQQQADGSSEMQQVVVKQPRSVSMPKQYKRSRVDTTPTPPSRRIKVLTEDNEKMSEETLTRTHDRKNEQLSEISVQALYDKRNERFSEVEQFSSDYDTTPQDNTSQSSTGWLSQGRRSGWGYSMLIQNTDGVAGQDLGEVKDSSKPTVSSSQQVSGNPLRNVTAPPVGTTQTPMLLVPPKRARQRERRLSIRSASDDDVIRRRRSQLTLRKRSRSANNIQDSGKLLLRNKTKQSMPLLTKIRHGPISNRAQTWLTGKKPRMRHALDFNRRVTAPNAPQTNETQRSKSRLGDSLGNWAAFPSHTRAARNGATGTKDMIQTFDFDKGDRLDSPNGLGKVSPNCGKSSLDLRPQSSWAFFNKSKSSLIRSKSKSMNFALNLEERAKRKRRGFVGQVRRLYRSQSSEMRAFAGTHGHRTSISISNLPEYPELECLPGEGALSAGCSKHQTTSMEVDGPADDLPDDNGTNGKSPNNGDTAGWENFYAGCVGRLPTTESDIYGASPNSLPFLDLSSGGNEHIVDTNALAKQTVINVVPDDIKGSGISNTYQNRTQSFDEKMPGSFE